MTRSISIYGLMIIIVASLCSFSALHEFYISITSIDYNKETKQIEITGQYTAHDIEKAILKQTHIDLHVGEANEHEKADSLIYNYITSRLNLTTDKSLKLNFVGKEFNLDETLWVYLESEPISKPKKITITNSVMTELFDAQSNITHVNFGSKQQTKSLNKINKTHTFLIH